VPTRERILEVAEEIISRSGMEGMRLKDVAAQVGIQPPSIFAHFEGREAIGNAVAARVLDQLAALVERETADRADPARALRRGVRAVAAHLYDRPAHARLLLRDLARTRSGPEELEMWTPAQGRIEARIAALLEAGIAQGQFQPLAPEAFLPILEGAILALIGWSGFDAAGLPTSPYSRAEIERRAVEVATLWVGLDPKTYASDGCSSAHPGTGVGFSGRPRATRTRRR
jgi:AcrR family transcriptional regulator